MSGGSRAGLLHTFLRNGRKRDPPSASSSRTGGGPLAQRWVLPALEGPNTSTLALQGYSVNFVSLSRLEVGGLGGQALGSARALLYHLQAALHRVTPAGELGTSGSVPLVHSSVSAVPPELMDVSVDFACEYHPAFDVLGAVLRAASSDLPSAPAATLALLARRGHFVRLDRLIGLCLMKSLDHFVREVLAMDLSELLEQVERLILGLAIPAGPRKTLGGLVSVCGELLLELASGKRHPRVIRRQKHRPAHRCRFLGRGRIHVVG